MWTYPFIIFPKSSNTTMPRFTCITVLKISSIRQAISSLRSPSHQHSSTSLIFYFEVLKISVLKLCFDIPTYKSCKFMIFFSHLLIGLQFAVLRGPHPEIRLGVSFALMSWFSIAFLMLCRWYIVGFGNKIKFNSPNIQSYPCIPVQSMYSSLINASSPIHVSQFNSYIPVRFMHPVIQYNPCIPVQSMMYPSPYLCHICPYQVSPSI